MNKELEKICNKTVEQIIEKNLAGVILRGKESREFISIFYMTMAERRYGCYIKKVDTSGNGNLEINSLVKWHKLNSKRYFLITDYRENLGRTQEGFYTLRLGEVYGGRE